MTDASAKREVLEELIASSQEKLAALQQQVEFEQRYLHDLEAKLGALRSSPAKRAAKRKRQGTSFEKGAIAPGSLTSKAVEMFKESAGQELQAAQIARELTSRGVPTKSKNGLLPMVVSTLSRRKDVFEKVGRGRYKLKEGKE